ncbi:DUF4352 domain-containing protein [Paractinoplanes ferrugineus]|nr:DUF4352 domain-containing protein [Actinoplanes ferrugineus]
MAQDVRPSRGPAPLKPVLAVLFACVAVAALFAAGMAADRYGSRKPAAAAPAVPARTSPGPGVGTPARDGKFEFVVSGVDCSRTSLGVEHLKRTAKGKFCVVSLSVRNISDDARYFLGRAQKAFDSAGTEYRVDEIADLYLNRDTDTFLDRLGPGERAAGKLVFDVPRTVRPTRLELHDSPLSGGVRVTVR